MTHKRLEPQARRDQILQAAIDLAREKGFHGLTRDGVALQAEVSFGLVTRYFGSLEVLKQKVMRAAIDQDILPIIATGLALGDPLAKSAPPELKERAAASISA